MPWDRDSTLTRFNVVQLTRNGFLLYNFFILMSILNACRPWSNGFRTFWKPEVPRGSFSKECHQITTNDRLKRGEIFSVQLLLITFAKALSWWVMDSTSVQVQLNCALTSAKLRLQAVVLIWLQGTVFLVSYQYFCAEAWIRTPGFRVWKPEHDCIFNTIRSCLQRNTSRLFDIQKMH